MRIASLLMFQLLICPTDNSLVSGHALQKWCVVKCTKRLTSFPSNLALFFLFLSAYPPAIVGPWFLAWKLSSNHFLIQTGLLFSFSSGLFLTTLSGCTDFCLLHQGESSYEYLHGCFSEEL